jgi:hypothetical protein
MTMECGNPRKLTHFLTQLHIRHQALASRAGMAELADAADSKSADLRVLGVRLPLPAPAQIVRVFDPLLWDSFFLPVYGLYSCLGFTLLRPHLALAWREINVSSLHHDTVRLL